MKGVKAKWMAQRLKKPSFKSKRVSRIKGGIIPREELKFVDTVLTATAGSAFYTAAGVVTLLNGIATGDDYTTRDGRQATMRSVHVRTVVVNSGVSGASGGIARTMLIWDNAPNGALAAVADILASVSASAFPKVDNQQRFTVLRDHIVELGAFFNTATQAFNASPGAQKVDLYVPLADITQYSGTGATIASIQNGALLMLTIGDNQAWQNHQFDARVRFSDD